MKIDYVILLIKIGCILIILPIVDEITYERRHPKIKYVLELQYVNGSVRTEDFMLTENVYIQVNHHYSYHKYDYYTLQYVNDVMFGDHWKTLKYDVISYKILKIERYEYTN